METQPPVKPPRGVKHVKETVSLTLKNFNFFIIKYFQSGLLMSVIRTLSSSETNEQRDREKAKLEAEYKVSDRKLDELVSKHENDLNQVRKFIFYVSITYMLMDNYR